MLRSDCYIVGTVDAPLMTWRGVVHHSGVITGSDMRMNSCHISTAQVAGPIGDVESTSVLRANETTFEGVTITNFGKLSLVGCTFRRTTLKNCILDLDSIVGVDNSGGLFLESCWYVNGASALVEMFHQEKCFELPKDQACV